MKKPSVPKCVGGSQKIFLGCSTSSLAVFYVEQVALKSPRAPPLPATLFMRLTARYVKPEKFGQWERLTDTDARGSIGRKPEKTLEIATTNKKGNSAKSCL